MSGVRAFILWCMIGWQGSFIRPHTGRVKEGLCVSRICGFLVLPRVHSLVPRLPVVRRAWWRRLNPQHVILLPKSPRFLEQGLYLSFAFSFASFHTLTPVKVAFITHGWWSTPWGCGHLHLLAPTDGANVDAESTGRNTSPFFPAKDVWIGCPNTPSEAQFRKWKPVSEVAPF